MLRQKEKKKKICRILVELNFAEIFSNYNVYNGKDRSVPQ